MGTYSGYYSSDFIRYTPVGVSYSVPMSTAVRSMVPVKSYYGGYRAYGYNGNNAGLPVSMHGPGCPPSCRSQCFMSGKKTPPISSPLNSTTLAYQYTLTIPPHLHPPHQSILTNTPHQYTLSIHSFTFIRVGYCELRTQTTHTSAYTPSL